MKLIKLLFLILLLLTAIFSFGCSEQVVDLDSFTTCLTESGVKMFGASWCPHCQHQKEMFKDSFDKIDFTECSVDKHKCANEGIEYLPTWKFADGTSVSGVQEFTELGERAGCELG